MVVRAVCCRSRRRRRHRRHRRRRRWRRQRVKRCAALRGATQGGRRDFLARSGGRSLRMSCRDARGGAGACGAGWRRSRCRCCRGRAARGRWDAGAACRQFSQKGGQHTRLLRTWRLQWCSPGDDGPAGAAGRRRPSSRQRRRLMRTRRWVMLLPCVSVAREDRVARMRKQCGTDQCPAQATVFF